MCSRERDAFRMQVSLMECGRRCFVQFKMQNWPMVQLQFLMTQTLGASDSRRWMRTLNHYVHALNEISQFTGTQLAIHSHRGYTHIHTFSVYRWRPSFQRSVCRTHFQIHFFGWLSTCFNILCLISVPKTTGGNCSVVHHHVGLTKCVFSTLFRCQHPHQTYVDLCSSNRCPCHK